MGTWGAGNLDNDSALDRFGDLMEQLGSEVSESLDQLAIDEGFDEAMAVIEIMQVLCKHSNGVPPKVQIISSWQDRLLEVFDSQIDSLGPGEDFKDCKRDVLVKTFDDLKAASREFWKHAS